MGWAEPKKRDGGSHTSTQVVSETLMATYFDTFEDYYRGEKLVLRKRKRITKFHPKGTEPSDKYSGATHDLQLPLNGKVIAEIGLGEARRQLTIITPSGIQLSRGTLGGGVREFMNICIPEDDYFEMIFIDGVNISFQNPPEFDVLKKMCVEATRKGYVSELDEGGKK